MSCSIDTLKLQYFLLKIVNISITYKNFRSLIYLIMYFEQLKRFLKANSKTDVYYKTYWK